MEVAMNISSVVAKVKPENLDTMIKCLGEIPHCEYHLHDELGRIILTIEAENLSEEMKTLKAIEATQGVLSAEMIYSYAKDELDSEREKLAQSPDVPAILQEEGVDAKDILYHGSVAHQVEKSMKKE